jgi:aspartate kinase
MTPSRRAGSHRVKASGIVATTGLSMIGVMALPDTPGVASTVLGAIGARGINVEFVVELSDHEGRSHILFCVRSAHLADATAAIADIAAKLNSPHIVGREDVALVAVYGPHFKDKPGCAAQAFSAIAEAGVNILAISTSVSSITSMVDAPRLETAIGALKKAFDVPEAAIVLSAAGLSRPLTRGR